MGSSESCLVRQKAVLVGHYGSCALVESVARASTRTEHAQSADGGAEFVGRLVSMGHMSPLEFVWLDFHVTTSRAIANELVRHRIASYCQESTRYVDLRSAPQFILPSRLMGDTGRIEELRRIYAESCLRSFDAYTSMIGLGVARETARDALPLGLATRLRVGMNMRSFRNFLQQRLAPSAAADMNVLAALMFDEVAAHRRDLLPMVADFKDEAEDVSCLG